MSVEGVSGVFEENSGEIKVSNNSGDVISDNCDSVNNSFIIMGHPPEEIVGDEGPINVFYKQVGRTIDENAVIFNDIKSVEEWLRTRTDLVPAVDFDVLRNDNLLNFNVAETDANNEEPAGIVLPQITNNSVIEESNISSINWEDFILESESYTNNTCSTRNKNFLLVPGIQSNCENELEIHTIDSFVNLPNITVLGSSPLKSNLGNQVSYIQDDKMQIDNITTVEVNKPDESSTNSILKKLPYVKIPKNCLIKGKILGKGDFSLLSGNGPISLLKSPSKTEGPMVVLSSPKKSTNSDISLISNGNQCKVYRNQNSSPNGKPAVMVLPVKPVNKVSRESLLKVNQSRSLLKTNNNPRSLLKTSNEVSLDTNSDETCINVTHNSPKKALPVAIVAISTNKSDNTTEIVIKTEDGENVYKGKTSDIMKATGSSNDQESETLENIEYNSDRSNDEATIDSWLVKLLGVSDAELIEIESTSSSQLQCPIEGCLYTTTKGSWLKIHILQHYGIRPFKCDFPNCTWAFYTSFRLKRHQEIHYKRKVFLCPVEGCGRTFSTIYNVNSHLKLHDRPSSVTCTINDCNQAFQTRKSYEKHLREHGPEHAPYTCNKEGCGKKYFTINSLNSHSRIHQHSEEELKCSYCSKMFDQPCRLKAHINTHIGVKPYKCDFQDCMWSFTTSSKLSRHQRKHTQMRKYHCKVCGKSFLRSEHLKDHSLKHFVKKSFVCPIADCGTVFSNKSSMYAHLKKHRNQETNSNESLSYPCPMDHCDLVFNTEENLRTHLQLNHLAEAIANDNSQDATHLLSDDHLMTYESLQNNGQTSVNGVISFNSMSQEGLLVGMSDLVQYIPAMEQGEYSESNSSNNIITHVVFTDNPAEEDSPAGLEESQVLTEIEGGIGSARTGLTYQATVEGKRLSETLPSDSEPAGLHMASDVVLSAGLLTSQDNLERGLLLQDELSGGDLYMGAGGHEEGGLLGPGGELQVLLLDPATRLQHSDFEQSTINLRDLE